MAKKKAKKRIKKCANCKYAGHNQKGKGKLDAACYFPMYDKNNKRQYRTMKYTTNSKDVTHCDRHEFVKP